MNKTFEVKLWDEPHTLTIPDLPLNTILPGAFRHGGETTMNLREYLNPAKLGWVHLNQCVLEMQIDLFSWGIALDPSGKMIAGMFAGRKTSLEEFHLMLTADFQIRAIDEEIDFSGFGKDTYQTFDQPLPNGQGRSRLYLHRGVCSDEPVEMGGILFFYVWGPTPEAPDFDLWANKMQDVHRIPVRKSWYPHLWEIMVARGWVQPCWSVNFGSLWEVSATSEEWQEMILENLDEFERRSTIGNPQQDHTLVPGFRGRQSPADSLERSQLPVGS